LGLLCGKNALPAPWKLASLVQSGVKATLEDIAKSLEGNWREELLFVLRQQVELYRIYQEKITDCDLPLRKHLESFGSKRDLKAQPIGPKPKGKKGSRNAPQFDLRTELYRITGIDWAQANADANAALGPTRAAWPRH